MLKQKKHLTTLAIVFAIVLTVGVVYAATTGVLNFSGRAVLPSAEETVRLEIVPEEDSVDYMTITQEGQSAEITVDLSKYESEADEIVVSFTLKNTGDYEAKLGAEPVPAITGPITAVIGDYTADSIIAAAESSGTITVTIGLEQPVDEFTGDATFNFTIDYEAVIEEA